MRADLDHLPEKQRAELDRVRSILLDGFEAGRTAGGGGAQPWRRNGQVLKIILFGSYARTDWVDEPENGYLSDFDLLVIVNHEKLTDIADYWWAAEDRIQRDPSIGRTVNIIVHDLAEVNAALSRGEYFWTDIVKDGVALHEVPGHALVTPKPLTAEDAAYAAEQFLSAKSADLSRWIETAEYQVGRSATDAGFRKLAAFSLHQAVETAYACFLLVHTFYFPRSHNIKFLRSLAEDVDRRLTAAWPREVRADRRRFELLKRAYVEARYSDQYDVTPEDLAALTGAASRLRDLVADACRERIDRLRGQAGHGA